MIFATEKNIRDTFDQKEYKFFTDPYSVNVFGVRMKMHTNAFDDFICLAYYDDKGHFVNVNFAGTTDPGRHWLMDPMRKEGCAIMVPGQYLGAFMIGPHGRTQYEACRQAKPIPVYRDNNKDGNHDLDPSTIMEGIFWTNIHPGL